MDDCASLYTALTLSRHQIRVLDLLPGQHHESLICEMKTIELDVPITYEALSYVWGGSFDDREDITVNDVACNIGHNLAQALRYLRLCDNPRTLWVDALCINQSDVAERTRQVQMMGEIYRTSERTVVWLGSFARPGRLAMDFIQRVVGKGMVVAFGAGEELARQSLRLVLQCPWWQRAWIIQELVLSKAEPMLYCGDRSLPWSVFAAFWDMTTSAKMREDVDPREAAKWQDFAAHIAPLRLIRDWPAEQRSWPRLMLLTSHYLATDPRDRVFALHGLCSTKSQVEFLPDYGLDIPTAYTVFTRFMVQHHGLDFLCFDKPRIRTDLPSWVPDYSSTCSLVDTCGHDFLPEEITYRVDAGLSQTAGFPGDILRVLRIQAISVDQVIHVVKSGQEIGMKAVFEASRSVYNQSYRRSTNPPLPVLLSCRKPGYLPEYTDQLNWLLHNPNSDALNLVPPEGAALGAKEQGLLPMLDFMYHAVKKHCFFATSDGLFGMGHARMQEGDRIFIVPGCATPLIIRDSTYAYQQSLESCCLVGSCKIPALLGPEHSDVRYLSIE